MLLIIILLFISPNVSAEKNCFTASHIAGIIFVTSFTIFFAVIGILLLIWYFHKYRAPIKEPITTIENGVEDSKKVVYNERKMETANKAVEAIIVPSLLDKMTSCNSLTINSPDNTNIFNQQNKLWQLSRPQQRNYDYHAHDSINVLKDVVRYMLDKDTSALGFQIAQKSDGICISHVVPNGPAHRSGNIFVGDKIKGLTIMFEKMPISDALTILSCASTYRIRLELERAIIDNTTKSNCTDTKKRCKQMQQNILCKSHSTSDLALPSQNKQRPNKTINGGSFMSTQKHKLPRQTTILTEDKMPSAVLLDEQFGSPPAEKIDPVSESTILENKMIIPKEQWPQYPEPALKCLQTSLNSIPTSSYTTLLPEIASKLSDSSYLSSPKEIHQPSSQISSEQGKRALLLLTPEGSHEVDEIKHSGLSEFVERSRFTYTNSATKKRQGKSCIEFCELIEPKRESIVVEFKEDKEQSPEEVLNNEVELSISINTCIEDQMNINITNDISPTITSEAYIVPTTVNDKISYDTTCPATQIESNTLDTGHISPQMDGILENAEDIQTQQCSNPYSTSDNVDSGAQSSSSTHQNIHPVQTAAPNSDVASNNKSIGIRMIPNISPTANSSDVLRRVTRYKPSEPAGQKSPKRSRLSKISCSHGNVDEGVSEKESRKSRENAQNVKNEQNNQSIVTQRSPKVSPRLQSHIPIVARSPSTKSKNKLLKVGNNKFTDNLSSADGKTMYGTLKSEMNGASLYIAKKEALRKTYLPFSKSNKGEEMDLSKERQERLNANQAVLQRQQEELRALGILP